MEEKELWMSKLKEKLADYSEPTPASGWEQLEKELIPPVEKKIYPYRRWTMAAAAVILLAIVSSLSLYFLGTPAADEIRYTRTPILASSPDALPDVQQPDVEGMIVEPVLRPVTKDRLAKTEEREHKKNEIHPITKSEQQMKVDDEAPRSIADNDNLLQKNVEPNSDTLDAKTTVTDKQPSVGDKKNVQEQSRNKSHRPSSRDKLHIPVGKSPSKKGKWSMGLSVGNSGGASSEIGSGISANMARVSMAAVSNGLIQQIPNGQTLVFEEGIPYLRQTSNVVDIEHHQPISFGLSVRKGLGRGFSLETGLTYTLLSSDVKLVNSDHKVKQKLHYLGIPLRANWNFLDKKYFTLYITGGGMMEKCVYGKLDSEKETVKPLQFSVMGGVGAQVNATKRVGIYVEPGVSYFFDDGSNVQTIRKENPFNFNIQAGIRLTY